MIQKRWVCDWEECGKVSEPLIERDNGYGASWFEPTKGWVTDEIKRPPAQCPTCGHSYPIMTTGIWNSDIRHGKYGIYHFCCEDHRQLWREAQAVRNEA